MVSLFRFLHMRWNYGRNSDSLILHIIIIRAYNAFLFNRNYQNDLGRCGVFYGKKAGMSPF